MRRHVRIEFYEEQDIINEISGKVKDYATEISIIGRWLSVDLYEDSEGYPILLEELQKRNIEYSYSESREYTKDEIKQAKFFNIAVMYPWESDGLTADKFGTKYNYGTVCQKCGIGKEQISDLVIDKKKAARYDISTSTPEIIVNERLYNLLLENNITGCEFNPVKDFKGREEVALYQLVITNILPKMVSEELKTDIDKTCYCDACKMHGVMLRSDLIYSEDALRDAKDFNLSHEFFGGGMYCTRQIVVSAKVLELFKKNKIKRIASEPVRII